MEIGGINNNYAKFLNLQVEKKKKMNIGIIHNTFINSKKMANRSNYHITHVSVPECILISGKKEILIYKN